jgi:hypothetical protein
MNRVAVSSSSVASIGYDPVAAVLEIEFQNGRIYQYLHVPPQAHRLLLQADSKGEFVNKVIKPRFEAVSV